MPTSTTYISFPYYRRSEYYRSDLGRFDDSTKLYNGQWVKPSLRVTASNPNYKLQIARRQDASRPYTMSSISGTPVVLAGDATWDMGILRPSGPRVYARANGRIQPYLDLSTLVYTGDDTTLRDQALARLKSKLSSSTKQAQALVPAAELRELRGLITKTADLASNGVKTLLDIKRTKGRSALRFAKDAWLSYSFGLAPMISDTKKICESVSEYLTRNDFNIRLTGTATREWQSGVKSDQTGLFGTKALFIGQCHHVLSYRYIAGFDVLMKSGNDYGAAAHLGLQVGQLPSVAWELMPYSWAMDYFGTVGDYLEDVFLVNAAQTKFVVLVKQYRMTGQSLGSLVPAGAQVVNSTCSPGEIEYFRIDRIPYGNTLPTRSVRFKTMDEMGLHGVKKLLNLSALLAGSVSYYPTRKRR